MDHLPPGNKRSYWIFYVSALLCLGLVVAFAVVYVVHEQQVARERVFVELSQNTHLDMVWDELLMVADDDMYISGFGTKMIDMSARHKHFTDKAWVGYQSYVVWQKEQLKLKKTNHAVYVSDPFSEENKNSGYDLTDDGRYRLLKNLSFSYGSGCRLSGDGKIWQLDIFFTLDEQGRPLISQWAVGP